MLLNFKMEATATATATDTATDTATAWPRHGHATDTATPRYSPKIGRFTVLFSSLNILKGL